MNVHVSPPEPAGRPPKPVLPPFTGLPDNPAMQALRGEHFVAWDWAWIPEKEKWDKPPINPKTGGNASTSAPTTWGTYEIAAAHARKHKLAGIGVVLRADGDLSGFDLDGCRDPETGKLQAWAQVAVDFAETYTEVSPSGRGLRFFVRGTVECRKVDAAKVEIYTSGRYLTVTGQHVAGTPLEIREAPRTLAYLIERADHFKAAQQAAAELTREAERKKAERRAEGQAREPHRQTTSERASASARERGPREGTDFWRTVNDCALANLGAWVPNVFPSARYQSGTGAYRVDQRDLGEGYEEDLSLHPNGIRDFGIGDMGDARDGARSPIDIVRDYLPATDAAAAAMWLCERLGVRPEDIGWRTRQEPQGATPQDAPAPQPVTLRATAFEWTDPATIPQREWIYARHYIRRFASLTVASGGLGKSTLVQAEALAMVSGRALLGVQPDETCRVWLWNGEDPADELKRRIMAACLRYGISRDEIAGRLFLDSGREQQIVVATQTKDGTKIAEPMVEAVIQTIRENQIDVLIIDPFVSCHEVPENDNGAIDRVAKLWGKIADQTGCAVELVHHSKKTGGAEVTVEDSRGGGALLAAARSGRVLNGMTTDEAKKAGVENRRSYFRVDNGKSNMAAPADRATWYKLEGQPLGNGPYGTDGDSVAVVTTWEWPDLTAGATANDLDKVLRVVRYGGPWRENIQCKNDWIGNAVAIALNLNKEVPADLARIKALLAMWFKSGALVTVKREDDSRRERPFVEAGEVPD